jgi:hypothetical protein
MPRAKAKDTPIMTPDARKALDEVSLKTWTIGRELEDLSEQELKAFVHQFQQRHDMEYPLHRAVITVAEHQLERMERHRTGSGA